MVTHHVVPVVNPFLAFQHGTVHVGDELASVCNVFMNVSDCYMGAYRKFSLEADYQ